MNCELVKKKFKTKEGKEFWKIYLVFDDGQYQIEGHKGEFKNENEQTITYNTAKVLIAKAKTLKD